MKALAIDPDHYLATLNLATLCARTKDPRREAQAARLGALSEREERAQDFLRIIKAVPYEQVKQRPDVSRGVADRGRHRPCADTPVVADPGLAEASRALAAGDTDRAMLLGNAYLQRHPADARAQVLLIRIHLARDEAGRAYGIATRAARAHPGDVDVLYHVGLVTRRLAVEEFQRLGAMAPDSARVHQLNAEMLEAQERRADAEKRCAAALAAESDLLEALLGLAKLQRIRLACDEARGLRRAERLRPTFDGAYGLGVCYSYLQNETP